MAWGGRSFRRGRRSGQRLRGGERVRRRGEEKPGKGKGEAGESQHRVHPPPGSAGLGWVAGWAGSVDAGLGDSKGVQLASTGGKGWRDLLEHRAGSRRRLRWFCQVQGSPAHSGPPAGRWEAWVHHYTLQTANKLPTSLCAPCCGLLNTARFTAARQP